MTTIHDFDRTAFAPRGEEPTSAYAWASSPLGDPTDSAADLPYEPHGQEFPPDPIAPEAKPKSINKTMVAAGLIGLMSAGTAVGIALFGGSSQPQHVAVASGSSAVPAAAPASAAPVVAAPDSGPAPAPVVNPPADGPVAAPVVSLPAPDAVVPPDSPPPPPEVGTPADAAPPGPVVIVNAPPPAIWVPVHPPQQPSPPSPPKLPPPPPPKLPAPPKLTPLPPPPLLCLPPHHLVQGVCK